MIEEPRPPALDTHHPEAEAIGRALAAWFRRTCRDLPWRRDGADPYRVWVSEIMLQQTQVRTVEPYYERWMRRFPTLPSLADADLTEVLRCWEGLGYYGRARRIHEAARLVMRRHGGQLPRSVDELRRLPGIGEYTAAAIAAIAFGVPAVALDANARRVLRRILGADVTDAGLRAASRAMTPPESPGAFVQSLFELGAMVCTARRAQCEECPVRTWCRGYASGTPLRLGSSRPTRRTIHRVQCAAVVESQGRVLVVRRRPEGLWAGLWEFPWRDQSDGEDAAQCAVRAASEVAAVCARAVGPLGCVRYAVTRFSVRLHAVRCQTDQLGGEPLDCAEAAWLSWDALNDLPMPSPHRRVGTMAARGVGSAQER